MRKHRSLFSPVYLLPLLLLPGLVAGTLLGLAGYVWAIAVWLYFPAVVLAGMLAAMRKRFGAFSLVVAILLGSHLAYGAGLWRGIALGPRGSDPGSPEGAGGASV